MQCVTLNMMFTLADGDPLLGSRTVSSQTEVTVIILDINNYLLFYAILRLDLLL